MTAMEQAILAVRILSALIEQLKLSVLILSAFNILTLSLMIYFYFKNVMLKLEMRSCLQKIVYNLTDFLLILHKENDIIKRDIMIEKFIDKFHDEYVRIDKLIRKGKVVFKNYE